ncbi:hypothetical protein DKM44_14400 [Deinococcus irradiatisoli]|uniref:YbjN domain-containing protein n=1 Tax=Deinococcus irradiatisoli TaxID=2202254 RepID=A0A2Z3JH05_9DEIO|nr:hypothetical protein [Deinococcus irradiatisoli]AWN24272.1 hypothetical protein DKM44_14400 [Deinococcus irradiatisoli]
MELSTGPERNEAERFPTPPQGEDFATLYRHLLNLKPLLTGWTFQEASETQRAGVTFGIKDNFSGQLLFTGDEFVVDMFAGKCPMDPAALRIMLRHKAWWRWMTRGVTADDGVWIFLNVRHSKAHSLDDLTIILSSGIEMAWKQRAELDVWWSRAKRATTKTQA